MNDFNNLEKSSRRNAWLSLYGAAIVIASLIYSYINLSSLEVEVEKKKSDVTYLKGVANQLSAEAESAKLKLEKLASEVADLQETQSSILDFLVSVTDNSKVHILDPSVNWEAVKNQLISLPSGDRKSALLNAILLAWKDIPFDLGKQSIYGFDSPRFLNYVLQSVNINIDKEPNQRMSDALMQSFVETNDPKPGDLVFFKGQIGSFGFILLSVGENDSSHVGIGTLQESAPLQIISMGNINTPYFPLKGYFKVKYTDEG